MNQSHAHHAQIVPRRYILADVLENSPFELALSWALVFFGARALLSGLTTAPGSVQQLPTWLALIYCVLSTIGGLSVIFGIFFRSKISYAYGFELLGLFISASAWGSYILGLTFSPITSRSTLLILALTALVIGSLLRARKIIKDSKATLTALRQAQQGREVGDA